MRSSLFADLELSDHIVRPKGYKGSLPILRGIVPGDKPSVKALSSTVVVGFVFLFG